MRAIASCTSLTAIEVIADGKYLCYPLGGEEDRVAAGEISSAGEISIRPIKPTVEDVEISAWRSTNSKALTNGLSCFTRCRCATSSVIGN